MLTLINGEKIVVLETCEDVVTRTIAYRASVYSEGRRTSAGPRVVPRIRQPTARRNPTSPARKRRRTRGLAHGTRAAWAAFSCARRHPCRPAAGRRSSGFRCCQPTAAMIVFGGTLGAVMLQFPLNTVFSAAQRLVRIFLYKNDSGAVLLRQIALC